MFTGSLPPSMTSFPPPAPRGTIHCCPESACQSAVMMGAEFTYHPSPSCLTINRLSSMWFTSSRSASPAMDQVLLIRAPKVQSPGCMSTTKEGPTLHFWVPRLAPPVGISTTGPIPQVVLLSGEKRPLRLYPPAQRKNCQIHCRSPGYLLSEKWSV